MSDLVKKYQEWVDSRPNDQSWLWKAGHFDKEENERLWNEIPDELKPVVRLIMQAALSAQEKGVGGKSGSSCMYFRHYLFNIIQRVREEYKCEIPITSYWYMDGIVIEPVEMVKLCNGLLGWTSDSGCSECGLDDCPFRGKP